MSERPALPPQVRVIERGWLSANNVLFLGRDETAVVDSGYETHADQTLALIASALEGRPLNLLLNTHLHSDHCGGNAALQRRYPDVRTFIPPGEAAHVEAWDERALSFIATGQRCPRFCFDNLLIPGQIITLGDLAWQVHAAPGHDPHSVVLFEPRSRTLISADALWENGFGVVFPELAGEPSFDEVAATLDLIERLDPAHVVPGHGPVFAEVSQALVSARSRLDKFATNPKSHAKHALKVLVKFKLLERQAMSPLEWEIWIQGTPYLETIRTRFFGSISLGELMADALSQLEYAGAVALDGNWILNR